jgi:hypothetical protein
VILQLGSQIAPSIPPMVLYELAQSAVNRLPATVA